MGSCCSKRRQPVTDHAFPEKNQVFTLQVPLSNGFQDDALQKLHTHDAPEEGFEKLATFDAAILASLTLVIPTNHSPFESDESLQHTSDPCETEDESQETMDIATIDVISEDAGRLWELDTSHDFTPQNSKSALEGLTLGYTREMFHESSKSIELNEMEIDRNSGVDIADIALFDAAILGSLTVVIPTNHPPFESDECLEHTSDPCETEDESQESGELGETMHIATVDVMSEDAGRSRELDTSHDFTPHDSKSALEGLTLGNTREMFHESSNSVELDEMEIDRNSGLDIADIAGHGLNFDALKSSKEEDHSDDRSVSDDLIIMALPSIQHFGTFSSNVSTEMKDADNGNSETADEQVLSHMVFRNPDQLHAYNAAHEPHNFLMHQINRTCKCSKKLPSHNDIVVPSSSEKFITSELPTSPNGYANQGPEEDLRLDDIGYGGFLSDGARISFSWDYKENEACHSDSEAFEFQPTNEFHQSGIKRAEQLQEAEESYKVFLSQEKRSSDLFEYKHDSFTGVCIRENAELVSASSGLFDLSLGREHTRHDGCQSLKQERSERDKYGSILRINSYNQLQDFSSTLSIEDIMNLLEKEELDENDLVSMLINAKASCQASDVTSESSFEFKIKSAGSTPHSTPSTPMFSASSTPRRISQLNSMALTPEEIAEIWGVFESRQTFSSY